MAVESELTFAEKIKTLSFGTRGRTRDRVREGRDEQGVPFKAVTDELGNTVTQRGDDRQDVLIRAPHLKVSMRQSEVRQ